MSIRKTLFGYEIRDGQTSVNEREAETVRKIFRLYRDGLSYQCIADTLNREGAAYHDGVPDWNKRKVNRTVENARYAGNDGYSAIIAQEDFLNAQTMMLERKHRRSDGKDSFALIKPYLKCGLCDGQMLGMGGRGQKTGTAYLKCRKCGTAVAISVSDLIKETERQMETPRAERGDYAPSDEAMRLENAIDRALERPDNPGEAIALIMKGISARYECCPNPAQRQSPKALDDMDAKQIGELISHISVSQNGAISVCLKGHRRIV